MVYLNKGRDTTVICMVYLNKGRESHQSHEQVMKNSHHMYIVHTQEEDKTVKYVNKLTIRKT